MKSWKTIGGLAVVAVVAGLSWGIVNKDMALSSVAEESAAEATSSALIGGEKDAHGCLIAAGYSWCGATNSCIRAWETYCTAAASKTVTFQCQAEKTITATFYPKDDKFVDLKLSDGRNISVPHAISGSGARYAKPDESFVFWNKGDTAFITEGTKSAQTETYAGCTLK